MTSCISAYECFPFELEPGCGIIQAFGMFASHLHCSTSAAAREGVNIHNARGHLQLMHLCCSQGGRKCCQTSHLTGRGALDTFLTSPSQGCEHGDTKVVMRAALDFCSTSGKPFLLFILFPL